MYRQKINQDMEDLNTTNQLSLKSIKRSNQQTQKYTFIKESQKASELNENENTKYQSLWAAAKDIYSCLNAYNRRNLPKSTT